MAVGFRHAAAGSACQGSGADDQSGTSRGGGLSSSGTGGQSGGGTAASGGAASATQTSTAGGAGGSGGASGSSGASGSGGASAQELLFSDDFEAHATGAPPGEPYVARQEPSGLSYVQVDTTRAKSGSQALKVHAEGGFFARAALVGLEGAALPFEGNSIYGRMMVFLPTAPASVHSYLIKGSGPASGGGEISLGYGTGGGDNVMANNNGPGCVDCTLTGSRTPMPIAQWVCMAWHFDGESDEMRLWLDGSEQTEMHLTDEAWKAPTRLTRIDIGWESYILDGDTAREVWIDDFALDDQPVPCP